MIVVFSALIGFVIMLFAVTYRYSFPKKQVVFLLLLLAVSLAFVGALLEPKPIYDLARHYTLLTAIKNSTYSLKSYLINGPNLLNSNYRYTYLFNILCYFIARYLPFQTLPFIAIFVSYACLMYVIVDHFDREGLSNRNILLSLALCQVIMPYLYVYSGIRNAMASAIIALAIYRFFYKTNSYIELAVWTIVSFLIHPVAFILVPFVLFSRIQLNFKRMLLPLLLPSVLYLVNEFVRLRAGNDLLVRIAAKYYNYTQVRADNQGLAFYVCALFILIFIVAFSFYSNYKNKPITGSDTTKRLINMIDWYALFSIGYFSTYEMLTRLPYNIAILSPVIVSSLFAKRDDQMLLSQGGPILVAGLFALSVYETVMWLI